MSAKSPPCHPDAPGPAPAPAVVGATEPKIGSPGQSVRALAFGGGAFDTIMQLGVVHALLVSEGKAPDVAAGISAGAIQAAAVAEILQAGNDLPPEEREAARIARFRTFLGAAEDMSTELVQQAFPDMFEIHTQLPLQSPQLPVHSDEERRERDAAARARPGLVNLLNAILSIRLRVGDAVRGSLQFLRIWKTRQTWRQRIGNILRLWVWATRHLIPLGLLWGKVLQASYLGKRPPRHDSPLNQILATGFRRRAEDFLVQVLGILHVFLMWLLLPFFVLVVLLTICYPLYRLHITPHPLPIAILFAVSVISWCIVIGRVWQKGEAVADGILAYFDIKSDLGNSHFLKQHLVQLFDPQYYGAIKMKEVLEAGLKAGEHPPFQAKDKDRKRLGLYSKAHPPIRVALLAADLAKAGAMVAVADDECLVDGLLAATAVTPLFEPRLVQIRDKAGCRQAYCIDAINIANEPILGIIELLRDRMSSEAGTAHVYTVSTFPISADGLPAKKGDAGASDVLNVVDVGLRARQLQRFQDAMFEQRLVGLYTRLLPANCGTFTRTDKTGLHVYVGAAVYPIEPTQPLLLNDRLAKASSNDERRRLVRNAVAQGCRAALETFIPLEIRQVGQNDSKMVHLAGGETQKYVLCQHAINLRRNAPNGTRAGLSAMEAKPVDAPPSPGLAEVCRECAVASQGTHEMVKRVIALRDAHQHFPNWPREVESHSAPNVGPGRGCATAPQAELEQETTKRSSVASEPEKPPAPVAAKPDPTVNFLFSGGVFRGVFQVGVVNALSEVRIRPSTIAGASVGSIMGAMAARAFSRSNQCGRRAQIQSVAATFLALDQLVLTDRLVDFVGRLGLRAAAARFSPHDLDRLFRQFELPASLSSRPWRRVLAGIERLFYLNPFDLKDIALKFRQRRIREGWHEAKRAAQTMLDRYGVGSEFLGAEPLALLISQLVIEKTDPADATFDLFDRGPSPIRLLAMTTNFTEGRLDILGERAKGPRGNLLQGLLAGAAFPAAFRPRWSREVYPAAPTEALYVDGGVMDNLPLDPLVQYLDGELAAGSVARRPSVPLLILTASLNPMPPPLDFDQAKRISESWWELRKRAAQLSDNAKVQRYTTAQEDLTRLCDDRENRKECRNDPQWEPLNLKIVTIIPKWLCGTFAFHPLLGFDRDKQAASIAHGCASTFAELHRLNAERPDWLIAWQEDHSAITQAATRFDTANLDAAFPRPSVGEYGGPPSPVRNDGKGQRLPNTKKEIGECWFREGATCPFSDEMLRKNQSLGGEARKALVEIYKRCGLWKTHQPR